MFAFCYFRSVPIISILINGLAAFALLIPCAAQDYSYHRYKNQKSDYEKTVRSLLSDTEADLGIKIICDSKAEPYLDQKIPVALWKLTADPVRRLSYILAPVDLTFEQKEDGSYRVFEPWYYIRPESEAKAHLERLLKRFPDKASWEQRKTGLTAAIKSRFLFDKLDRNYPIKPIVSDKRSYDGYSVQNVALEILPGYYMCGNLYQPESSKANRPIVLCPHGHGKPGRLGEDQQKRAATLARMGAVCFTYNMFAWQTQESPLQWEDHRDSISGPIQTLQTMRAIDWLTTLPDIDADKIGITGASGGGTQTFMGAALDPRITVAVPVVMVSSHFQGGCPCESGIPFHIDCAGTCNAEVAAMIAPRPLLVVAVTQDWTKNVPEVEYPYLKQIYNYYGAADKVEFAISDEPHNYGPTKRAAMYPFMAKYLGLDESKIDESKVTVETGETMFVFGPNHEKYPADGVQSLDELKQRIGL